MSDQRFYQILKINLRLKLWAKSWTHNFWYPTRIGNGYYTSQLLRLLSHVELSCVCDGMPSFHTAVKSTSLLYQSLVRNFKSCINSGVHYVCLTLTMYLLLKCKLHFSFRYGQTKWFWGTGNTLSYRCVSKKYIWIFVKKIIWIIESKCFCFFLNAVLALTT